jgi:lysophospholipase L1-like esterase
MRILALRERANVKRTIAAAVLSVFAWLGMTPASAQDAGLGGSFITPFPQNDTYQVKVIGDWLADGLLGGLTEAFAASPAGVQFAHKRYRLSGLRRNRYIDRLEKEMANDPSHIAIVMLGVEDRYSISSRRKPKADQKWRAEYGARVDRAMKILKKGGRAVYWVGLPNMRRWKDNERAQMMNDIYRERAYLNGVRYIDAYASFIDEGGGYSDYGPDVTGKVRRLRYRDGIHFTDAGYRKLAHFVERELKRDLAQARLERSVPLAGNPSEQAKVNPDRARLKAESARSQKGKTAKAGVAAPAVPAKARGQKADSAKVDIKVPGPGGTERVVTVDIVRPAIPASVVALMTRRSSADRAAQMGDILVDQIPGGLTVMSSIVPPRGGGGRRGMSPTQTPYFRVFERGERLVPKPGRIDDFSWPRRQAAADLGAADRTGPPLPVQSP